MYFCFGFLLFFHNKTGPKLQQVSKKKYSNDSAGLLEEEIRLFYLGKNK